MNANSDVAALSVDSQNEIGIRDAASAPISCVGGTPKVTNVNTIEITDTSTGGLTRAVIKRPNRFAPGFSAAGEGSGPNEIEFMVDLGDGMGDVLRFDGYPSNRLNLRYGQAGVNTNAVDLGSAMPDVDVSVANVEGYEVRGSKLGDTVIGYGATPSDSPAYIPLTVNGMGANDLLGGGEITPDVFNGGSGTDTVTYVGATTSVLGSIDGVIYQNNTVTGHDTLSHVENLIGGKVGDELSGDDGANSIHGGPGPDELKGKGGRDRLFGDRGSDILRGNLGIDKLFAFDHNKDTRIDCGAGSNADESATADPQDPGAGQLLGRRAVMEVTTPLPNRRSSSSSSSMRAPSGRDRSPSRSASPG